MTKDIKLTPSLDELLDCFGNFNIEDPVCKSLCALNLRCAIEQDQNTRMEILEDLVSSSGMTDKIQ